MENEQADAGRDGRNLSREIKISDTNGDREILIFPVQLTTSRSGNLTRLIHYMLAVCDSHTIMYLFGTIKLLYLQSYYKCIMFFS